MTNRTVTDFIRDLAYAFRLIRKSPLFSLYVIAPLALGIGLNGAIFMLLDTFLLRPLPVKNPENLVRVVDVVQNLGPRSYYSYNEVRALQQKSTSFSDVLAAADLNGAVRDASGASRVRAQVVTGNFFTALGVQPLLGRVLTVGEEREAQASPPVVLSYFYWQRQFHGDPGVIGKTLTLEERPFAIAGVMPRWFNGLEVETTPDVRIPLAAVELLSRTESGAAGWQELSYSIFARLRPGVALEQARQETAGIIYAVRDQRQRTQVRNERLEVERIANGVSRIRPKFSSALILLMSGVGLLLLMICANAGGLLLARASARREETAVRLAVGATPGRLFRQWLTESLLLTSIGGLAGLCVAWAAIPLLVRAMPTLRDLDQTMLTVSVNIQPDARLYAFAMALCVLCALIAGLPAAVQAMHANLHSSLKAARASLRQPMRWTLVALQVGLCTFLLAGAGLLVATFQHLRAMDPGFDRDHVVTFSLAPGMMHYTPQQAKNLESQLLEIMRGLPGVRSAAIASVGLMHGTGIKTTVAPAGQKTPRSDFLNTSLNFVSPEYFDTMGIPMLAGRNFRADEPATDPSRVIVNQAFVRRFFPAGDALGQRFGTGVDTVVKGSYEIVGVVGDAKYRSLREVIPPTVYQFRRTDLKSADAFILHVRTKNRPEGIMQAVRKTLNAIDPRLPFYEARTLAEEVDATLWAERLLAWLSAVFAIVAAALATLGVYATLAYAIAQSRREIGVRIALGARAADVVRLFSAQPLRFAGLGVVLGWVGFYAATPGFRSVLFGVTPTNPVTMAWAAAAVLLIALAATLIAVMGALRVDPAAVLREE